MNADELQASAPEASPALEARTSADRDSLITVALCLGIAAAAWYLLRELAPLLRPLLLAVLLCYVIVPTHLWLRQRMPRSAAVVVLSVASVAAVYLLALMVYGSVIELSEDLPIWVEKAQSLFKQLRSRAAERLPWLSLQGTGTTRAETQGLNRLTDAANTLAAAAADVLGESIVVGFYLLFLLLELRRLPQRVRTSFTGTEAEQILAIVGNINAAMSSFIKVKVRASLVLAIPATLVLWVFGVRFAVMWGVLTFSANFIPYLGSIVACSLPILLAFLQMDLGWRPVAVAILLISIHVMSAYLIEPAMTGKAVGLSPLIILLSLAFWGLCWGLIGMVLAVPLTVMLKIIFENVPFTRPLARLMGEE